MAERDVDIIEEEADAAYMEWNKGSGVASYLLSSYAMFRLGYLWALRKRGLPLVEEKQLGESPSRDS